ncbi:tripartite tricarboxylate transporter substrate-binding protein, partial [Acinetobacter nosocomialis]|uniref:tripartite tricarboxylate transporter substrate-binding protein n=1 Tax=Acinetobacter nosocomialis TaxID=106654 RepID=UPI0020912D27
ARTVADLVATGKARAGKLQFASPGVGTSVHLLSELFRLEAGFEAVHVPYRGGAPAVNDLLGGHIDF